MNTRLAQLIAQSTTSDGGIDRARLLDALHTTPDDPLLLVIEAALLVEMGLARQRHQETAHANALGGVFAEHAGQFRNVLTEHVDKMETVKEQLVILAEEIEVARTDARTKFESDSRALVDAAGTLSTHAAAMRAETERIARRTPLLSVAGIELHGPDTALVRSLVILLVGFFAGVSVILIYFLLH